MIIHKQKAKSWIVLIAGMLFFFFWPPPCSIWSSWARDQIRATGSLTHSAGLGVESPSDHSRDAANPVVLQWELLEIFVVVVVVVVVAISWAAPSIWRFPG